MTDSKPEAPASRDSFDLTGEAQAEPSRRIAALEAALAHEREQTQRWRKAAIDYINVLETERELRQAAEAKVVVWEERAALRQRKLKTAERERDYYRDGYEIALDQWEQCRDGWDAAEAALATLQAKHDDLVLYLADWRHRALAAEALALGSPQTEAPEPRGTSA